MLTLETQDYEAMLLGALAATAVTFGAHFTPSTSSADANQQRFIRRSSAKEVDLQLQAVKKQTESQFPVVFLLGAPMTPRQEVARRLLTTQQLSTLKLLEFDQCIPEETKARLRRDEELGVAELTKLYDQVIARIKAASSKSPVLFSAIMPTSQCRDRIFNAFPQRTIVLLSAPIDDLMTRLKTPMSTPMTSTRHPPKGALPPTSALDQQREVSADLLSYEALLVLSSGSVEPAWTRRQSDAATDADGSEGSTSDSEPAQSDATSAASSAPPQLPPPLTDPDEFPPLSLEVQLEHDPHHHHHKRHDKHHKDDAHTEKRAHDDPQQAALALQTALAADNTPAPPVAAATAAAAAAAPQPKPAELTKATSVPLAHVDSADVEASLRWLHGVLAPIPYEHVNIDATAPIDIVAKQARKTVLRSLLNSACTTAQSDVELARASYEKATPHELPRVHTHEPTAVPHAIAWLGGAAAAGAVAGLSMYRLWKVITR